MAKIGTNSRAITKTNRGSNERHTHMVFHTEKVMIDDDGIRDQEELEDLDVIVVTKVLPRQNIQPSQTKLRRFNDIAVGRKRSLQS